MAVRDRNNSAPEGKMGGLISGLCVVCLGLSMGLNTGGATNPVRDFGPRVAAGVFGIHSWRNRHFWAIWGAWCVPFLGGSIGACVYKWLIKPISTQKAKIVEDNAELAREALKVKRHEKEHLREHEELDELGRQASVVTGMSSGYAVAPGRMDSEATYLSREGMGEAKRKFSATTQGSTRKEDCSRPGCTFSHDGKRE